MESSKGKGAEPRPARPDELQDILQLLQDCGLPTDGVRDQFPAAYAVVRVDGRLAAVAGLESYVEAGLLRSVAVHPSARGQGFGRTLVEDRLRAARSKGLRHIYLLTTTAADYFREMGFVDCARAAAPAELRRSPELAGACPCSAVCLRRALP